MFYLCTLLLTVSVSDKVTTTSGFRSESIPLEDRRLNDEYKKQNIITKDSKGVKISNYSTNGGQWGGNTLDKAFDQYQLTFWEANIVNNDTFKSHLEVEFNDTVTVDRIAYGSRRDNFKRGGFPLVSTLYTKNSTSDNWTKLAVVKSAPSNNPFLVTFDRPHSFKFFKFEFTEIDSNRVKLASCAFLYFYKEDPKEVKDVFNLFTDYCQLSLRAEYNTTEKIQELNEKVKNYSYYKQALSGYIDRAILVANGTLRFESRRQFTTNPNVSGYKLPQLGHFRAHAYNTLRMRLGGTDRIPLGVSTAPQQEIRFYVEAEDGDALPQVYFSQHMSSHGNFLSGGYSLSPGLNIIKSPNLYRNSYKETIAGGPVYIINPYNKNQQSQKVKIYVDGGASYPLFRDGDNETAFNDELDKYFARLKTEKDLQNLCEIVTNHVILTVRASKAWENYIMHKKNGKDYRPQKTADYFNRYMRDHLKFIGVQFDKSEPYYNEINEHLSVNLRITQRTGGLISASENVGMDPGANEDIALRAGNIGWGFGYVIGVMWDEYNRVVTGSADNMFSNVQRVLNESQSSRPDHLRFTNLMSQGFNVSSTAYDSLGDIGRVAVWFNIETLYPGFWARLNNLYRYNDTRKLGFHSANEQMVYYSSIATGHNLSYYYEKCGLHMYGPKYTYKSSSNAFKAAMNELAQKGLIKEKELKFWYYGNQAYKKMRTDEKFKKLPLYNESMVPETPNVTTNDQGEYVIQLPPKSDLDLAFEVYRSYNSSKYEFIGYSYESRFVDKAAAKFDKSITPVYKYIAYDFSLNHTNFSKSPSAVKINNVTYSSLQEAINQSKENDTIYLLDNVQNFTFAPSHSLELRVDNSLIGDVVLEKAEGNDIVSNDRPDTTLKIVGTPTAYVVFKGQPDQSSGSGISFSGGNLYLEYCKFVNINSSRENGSAISVGNNKYNLHVKNSIFENNQAERSGAAIYAPNVPGSVTLIEGCTFTGNSVRATGDKGVGGALYVNSDKFSILNSRFERNLASYGGAIASDKPIEVKNSEFLYNSGAERGGVVVPKADVTFDNCYFFGNYGKLGGVAHPRDFNYTLLFNNCNIFASNADQGGVLYTNIYSWGIKETKILFNNTNVYSGKAANGSFIYSNSGIVDINSYDNRLEGSIAVSKQYPSGYLNYSGSVKYAKLVFDVSNAASVPGTSLLNFSQPLGDEYPWHFVLKRSLRDTAVLVRSADKKSLQAAAQTFKLTYHIKDKDYKIDSDVTFDSVFALSLPKEAPEGICVTGYYYNGYLYNVTDKVVVSNSGYIMGQYTEGGCPMKLRVLDKEYLTSKQHKRGDYLQLPKVRLSRNQKLLGYLYAGKVYEKNEKIQFDGVHTTVDALVEEKSSDNTKLLAIVGSCVGIAVVAGVIATAFFIMNRKNNHMKTRKRVHHNKVII